VGLVGDKTENECVSKSSVQLLSYVGDVKKRFWLLNQVHVLAGKKKKNKEKKMARCSVGICKENPVLYVSSRLTRCGAEHQS